MVFARPEGKGCIETTSAWCGRPRNEGNTSHLVGREQEDFLSTVRGVSKTTSKRVRAKVRKRTLMLACEDDEGACKLDVGELGKGRERVRTESVSIMTRRSIPSPHPPVGGRPCSRLVGHARQRRRLPENQSSKKALTRRSVKRNTDGKLQYIGKENGERRKRTKVSS